MRLKLRQWFKRIYRRKSFKIVALAVLATLVYGAVVPPRRVQVSKHNVQLTGLDKNFDGLRIAQITDLHVGLLFQEGSVKRIVDLTNSFRPDLVVITGDFTNCLSIGYLQTSLEELRRLRPRFGTYACLGNHDHWEDAEKVTNILTGLGIHVLNNKSVLLDNGLPLAGIDDLMSGDPDLNQTLKGIAENEPAILLSHNPAVLPQVADRSVLVLSGHTHGGQIALPFLGPRGTMSVPGINQLEKFYESLGVRARRGRLSAVSTYRYPAGWYRNDRAQMYVCRGAGSNQTIPIRLNCPPEIACFTLRSE